MICRTNTTIDISKSSTYHSWSNPHDATAILLLRYFEPDIDFSVQKISYVSGGREEREAKKTSRILSDLFAPARSRNWD
jgi:hypothetical protein